MILIYHYIITLKEVGIGIKRKETSSQLVMVIIHQPALVTMSSNIYSQMHAQIKQSLAKEQIQTTLRGEALGAKAG